MKKSFVVIFFCLFLISCSHSKILNIKIPELPKVLPVVVEGSYIKGDNVDNVVENHIQVWAYVYQLRALLGEKNIKVQK